MIERTLIVLILTVLGVVAYRLLTRRQVQRVAACAPQDPLLRDVPVGTPAIVYFTTPTCAPCRLQQTPTLKRLEQELGDGLRVIRVDAFENPEAAERWGVFSVPTTFVFNAAGQPCKVYNGVVDGETLKRDLSA
jgi:thiol-disulfide isomerase/thioredoxin